MPKKRKTQNTLLESNRKVQAELDEFDLTFRDAEIMGCRLAAPNEIRTQLNLPKSEAEKVTLPASMRIPYFDRDGAELGFHRNRLLDLHFPEGEDYPRTYSQPIDEPPAIYYSPLLTSSNLGRLNSTPSESWSEVISDTTIDLFVVDEEFTASALCKEGVPTIAVGAFGNWRTNEVCVEFDRLMDVSGRNVFISFETCFRLNGLYDMARYCIGKGGTVSSFEAFFVLNEARTSKPRRFRSGKEMPLVFPTESVDGC